MEITREDIRKEIAQLRAAVERDPLTYGPLRLLLNDPPDEDYDPQRLSVARAIVDPSAPELPTVELAIQKAPRATKLDALESRRALFMEELLQNNAALKDGRMAVQDWLSRLTEELRGLHISAYTAGRAGRWEEMTYRDWGRVGQVLRLQYDYARKWASEIALKGTSEFSLAQLNARARLYASAAQQTFEQGMMAEIGLDPGIFPAWPGQGSPCRANCRCRWSVRVISKARGDYSITWRMGAAEHCVVCRKRARKWVGLRVRGGVLVSPVEPING